jgi:hypothetical protein
MDLYRELRLQDLRGLASAVDRELKQESSRGTRGGTEARSSSIR